MHCILDLRFAIPPLVNVILSLLLNSQGRLWDWEYHPVIKMTSLILVFLLFYLLLSFLNLPLSLTLTIPNHRIVGFGNLRHFSMPLGLTLLASFFFPPPPFWYAYLVCIGAFSPWWNSALGMLNDFLHATPVSIVTRGDQGQQEEEETLESGLSSRVELHELGGEADDYVLNELHDENLEIVMYGHA